MILHISKAKKINKVAIFKKKFFVALFCYLERLVALKVQYQTFLIVAQNANF